MARIQKLSLHLPPEGIICRSGYLPSWARFTALVMPLIGSKQKLDSLPADLQKILAEEAKSLLPFWWATIGRTVADAIKSFKAKGIVFTEVDHAAFRKAMDPVYASLQAKLGGDLIERITKIAGG